VVPVDGRSHSKAVVTATARAVEGALQVLGRDLDRVERISRNSAALVFAFPDPNQVGVRFAKNLLVRLDAFTLLGVSHFAGPGNARSVGGLPFSLFPRSKHQFAALATGSGARRRGCFELPSAGSAQFLRDAPSLAVFIARVIITFAATAGGSSIAVGDRADYGFAAGMLGHSHSIASTNWTGQASGVLDALFEAVPILSGSADI
jgi:hypothetical protein